MLNLDNISKFITFTIDLFNDEFGSYIDYVDSFYYFSHGGCYELAKIIKHYFPDAQFVMKMMENIVVYYMKGKFMMYLMVYLKNN